MLMMVVVVLMKMMLTILSAQWSSSKTSKTLHYGNIFEYLSVGSEAQFLNIQKSKKNPRNPKTLLIWTSLQRLARKLKKKNVDFKL